MSTPVSFQQLTGSIDAGQSAVGKAYFILGPGVDASRGAASWALIDAAGVLYANGQCNTYQVTPSVTGSVVETTAVISVPSNVPPSAPGQGYMLQWSLVLDPAASDATYATQAEYLAVNSIQHQPLGPSSSVELQGDTVTMQLVLERQPTSPPTFVLYYGNSPSTSVMSPSAPTAVHTGYLYTCDVDTSQVQVSLDPYTAMWGYKQGTHTQRETGSLFVVNPSILQAIDDVQANVSKARTTMFGLPDALFDPVTILTWLRRGRDFFNVAGGMMTTFNMMNATGGVREMWLRYAEVAMLRAQALAEGEKAFNYTGLQTSLEVDKAPPYNDLAEKLASELENIVRDLKRNLKVLGVSGGDGDVANVSYNAAALGPVGLGINNVSPIFGNPRRPFW